MLRDLIRLITTSLLVSLLLAGNSPPTWAQPAVDATPPAVAPDFDDRALRADANAPPGRSRRQFGRLARVPAMFGDFFGSGGSPALLPNIRPGVLDGVAGRAVFLEAMADLSGAPITNVQHLAGQRVLVQVPNVVSFNGTNSTTFDVDLATPLSGPTQTFSIDSETLSVVNSVTNSTPIVAQYLPAIESAEAGANPAATLVNARVVVGPTGEVVSRQETFDLIFPFQLQTQVSEPLLWVIPNPATGGAVVGRQKIAENGTPLPTNRIFFNYSYFDNVALTRGGVSVNRMTPGFETTFLNGLFSLEARFPFATTLDHDITLGGLTNSGELVSGNITLNWKLLLTSSATHAVCAGVGTVLPTADDMTVATITGDPILRVDNESMRFMPFVGWVNQLPLRNAFMHGFLQVDTDTAGNRVLLNTGDGLQGVGRLNDTTLLYADVGVGWRMYHAKNASDRVQSLIPTVELHYNRSLQDADFIDTGGLRIGTAAETIELLHAVVGATMEVGRTQRIGIAYATPLGGGLDQQFDGELRVTYNWHPGGR